MGTTIQWGHENFIPWTVLLGYHHHLKKYYNHCITDGTTIQWGHENFIVVSVCVCPSFLHSFFCFLFGIKFPYFFVLHFWSRKIHYNFSLSHFCYGVLRVSTINSYSHNKIYALSLCHTYLSILTALTCRFRNLPLIKWHWNLTMIVILTFNYNTAFLLTLEFNYDCDTNI